jgi:hypothetical protein
VVGGQATFGENHAESGHLMQVVRRLERWYLGKRAASLYAATLIFARI